MLRAASFTIATLFLTAVVQAAPQAICGLHSQYLNTETGHTPCDIAATLIGGGVKPADSPFPELMNMGVNQYPAPKAEEADDLRCNPLFYNLVSACGACQGSKYSWVTWKEWAGNCKSISSFVTVAERLPSNLPIGSWAFIPPSATNGTWNKEAAFTESTTNVPDSYFPKLTITQASACSNNSLKTTIAAGVLGGVALIALGAVVFLLAKNRRNAKAAPQSKVAMFDQQSVSSITKERLPF